MEKLIICYEFALTMSVRKRNGKVYKRHIEQASGMNFENAVWTAFFKLKRNKAEILSISEARAFRITFAFEKGTLKRADINLSDFPPDIPQDLNAVLQKLPKKKDL
ncbi:hypothetical protein [Taibaiella koreensis]|uniref:hypothetical protein n=1 Tax=Taibaiella koreensis TaxID=1268548 RepID=UPI000E59E07B|nr:hypothetical protein [Taibaiella koreensis]